MHWFPGREPRLIVRYSVLLWLPILLLELTRPFELSAFALSPTLRLAFASAAVVSLGLASILGWFVATMAEESDDGRVNARATAGFAGATIAAALFVAILPNVQRWGLARDFEPHFASLFTIFIAALAGGLLSWLLSRGPGAHIRRTATLWTTAAGLVGWVVAIITRIGPEPSIAHVSAIACGAAALAHLLWRVGSATPNATHAARFEFPLAIIVPLLAMAITDAGSATGFKTDGGAVPRSSTNVIFLMIDTLRADYSDLATSRPGLTPRLAKAADRRGTRFHSAYSAAPNTIPSVKALFTGQLASHYSEDDNIARALPESAWTLAEAFQSAGFETVGITANGLVSGPGFEQGFDHFRSLASHDYFVSSYFLNRLLAGQRIYRGFWWMDVLRLHKESGEPMREVARSWLAEEREAPFFMYLHLLDPHWPYYDRDLGSVPNGMKDLDEPLSYITFLKLGPPDPRHAKYARDPRMREMKGRYKDEILAADAALGGVLDDLASLGLAESTLVVIAGDHGEEFFEHNAFGHGQDVYHEEVHVPLVFLWPEGAAFDDMPKSIESPVSLIDVLPTLTQLLDLPAPPAPILGASLVPRLNGEPETDRTPIIIQSRDARGIRMSHRAENHVVRFAYDDNRSEGAVNTIEVFDAVVDPKQQNPLDLTSSRIQAIVDRAREDLASRMSH